MSDYWDTVETIARDVLEQNGTDERGWHDYIHESVDGNQYIIYYNKNEEVLEQTRNEPDDEDVAGMCDPKKGWKDMRMVAAFMAMERDVYDKCKELADEYEPSYWKLKKKDGTFVKAEDIPPQEDVEQQDIDDRFYLTILENGELSFSYDSDAEDCVEETGLDVEVVAFNESGVELPNA